MNKAQMVSRTALAEAIKRHASERKEMERKRAALDNAEALASAAEARLQAASGECIAAREEHTERVMDAAATSSDLKPSSRLRTARIHEAEAQDEVDAARQAVTRMREALTFHPRFDGGSNDPAAVAGRDLEAEVDRTIRAEINLTSLLDECDGLLAELTNKRQAAVFLISKGLIPPERLKDWGRRLEPCNLPSCYLSGYLDDPHLSSSFHTDKPSPLMEAWKAARAALRSDPSTPLPSGPAPTTVVQMRKAG